MERGFKERIREKKTSDKSRRLPHLEEDPESLLEYLDSGRDAVSPNSLDPLGVVNRLHLVPGLPHVANIALLGLQETGRLHV